MGKAQLAVQGERAAVVLDNVQPDGGPSLLQNVVDTVHNKSRAKALAAMFLVYAQVVERIANGCDKADDAAALPQKEQIAGILRVFGTHVIRRSNVMGQNAKERRSS